MKKRRILLIVIACLVVFVSGDIWASYHVLHVSRYSFTSSKVTGSVSICVISDLHDHSFGKDNAALVEKISLEKPDVILFCGDLLNEDSKDASVAVDAISGLSAVAPVYVSLGNHEVSYMKNHPSQDLAGEYTDAGAVVLEQAFQDMEVNGNVIRLGGMYAYAFGSDDTGNTAASAPSGVKTFLTSFCDTSCLKIMMAHRPDSFVFGDVSSVYDIDLVVSGHDHGGQVVVPFLGGLYGGDQGWFPKYIHGLYQKDLERIFVTSGLSSQKELLPRFNNLPEIAMITINGGSDD